MYIILLLCTSNAVVNPAVTRGIIKARVGTLLFARCAGNKQGLHCPAKLPLQKRALINLLETTMSKRLDPEVKAANKIKFGKIRSERMMGDGNHFFGKHHTEESNEMNRASHEGLPAPRLGAHHTETSKDKMRESRIGNFGKPRESTSEIGTIPLPHGKVAFVDEDDYKKLIKHLWCVTKNRNTYYAHRTVCGKTETMHHAIMGVPPKGLMIDHINGNGLDNHKCNLRIVTNRQNCMNKHFWAGEPRRKETNISLQCPSHETVVGSELK